MFILTAQIFLSLRIWLHPSGNKVFSCLSLALTGVCFGLEILYFKMVWGIFRVYNFCRMCSWVSGDHTDGSNGLPAVSCWFFSNQQQILALQDSGF